MDKYLYILRKILLFQVYFSTSKHHLYTCNDLAKVQNYDTNIYYTIIPSNLRVLISYPYCNTNKCFTRNTRGVRLFNIESQNKIFCNLILTHKMRYL